MGKSQEIAYYYFMGRGNSGAATIFSNPRMFSVDDTFVYSEIELYQDADLEYFISTDLGVQASDCAFQLTEIALNDFADSITAEPEDYLLDDNQSAYEIALEMADIYGSQGADGLPPLAFYRDAQGQGHLLDGHKRLCAAQNQNLEQLPAYQVLVLPS